MAASAFVVREDERQHDIIFELTGAAAPSPTQLDLKAEVEAALMQLHAIRDATRGTPRDHAAYLERYRSLVALTQTGLVGPYAQPEVARRALATWRDDIVLREEGRIKNAYLRRIGGVALQVGGAATLLWATARLLPLVTPLSDAQPLGHLSVYGNFALLLAGCAAGVWLSFGARRTRWQLADLATPEADRLDPAARVALALAATTVVGLLLASGVVDVHLGNVAAAAFRNRGDVALIVGVLCGFSERSLGATLEEQAAKFFPGGRAP